MPGYEVSPEELAAFLAGADRQQMAHEARRLDVKHMLLELKPSHLAILRSIFNGIVAGGGKNYASYMEGALATTLLIAHPDVCSGCGEVHDADLPHGVAPKPESEDEPDGTIDGEALAAIFGLKQEQVTQAAKEEGWVQPSLFEDEPDPIANLKANFDLYGVWPASPSNPLGPVTCLGCGTESVSLEDRMLRDPGVKGCSGCQQKAKWG